MIPDPLSASSSDIRLDLPIRILLRRNTGLGDVILTTGIVRELSRQYRGQVLIDVATSYPAVFANNPHIRHVIAPNQPISIDGYDRIINLDSAYERNPHLHIAEAYATVAFGGIGMPLGPELFPDHASITRINTLCSRINRRFVVLHARNAPYFPARNFSSAFWREVVEGMLADGDCCVVTIGSESDFQFAGANIHSLHNQLGLQETLLLVEQAELFIGVDSGMLHIAACTQTPIVGLFTQALPEYRQPIGREAPFNPVSPALPCIGCIHEPSTTAALAATGCPANDLACTQSIPPSTVIAAAQKIRRRPQ